MALVSHIVLKEFVYDIYIAAGAVEEDARIVSDHLVDANLMGHDSHGVMRTDFYLSTMKAGPSADRMEIVRETPASVVINVNDGLGMVAAKKAMNLAIEKAKAHTLGAAALYNCGHAGRMGTYPPQAAEEGMIGIVLLNGGARFMHPFGGTSRRLPPNPIAISVPRKNGEPLLLDMTLSVVAGGKIAIKAARDEKMPDGWMIDSEGKSVREPSAFFNQDDTAVMPLGGFQFGHKGFGLGFMIDAIAGGLSWAGCSRDEPTRGGSGIVMIAMRIQDFIDLDVYEDEVEYMIDWVKSSNKLPGVDEIYVPGEFEVHSRAERTENGIPIEEKTWKGIIEVAASYRVPVPESLYVN